MTRKQHIRFAIGYLGEIREAEQKLLALYAEAAARANIDVSDLCARKSAEAYRRMEKHIKVSERARKQMVRNIENIERG